MIKKRIELRQTTRLYVPQIDKWETGIRVNFQEYEVSRYAWDFFGFSEKRKLLREFNKWIPLSEVLENRDA